MTTYTFTTPEDMSNDELTVILHPHDDEPIELPCVEHIGIRWEIDGVYGREVVYGRRIEITAVGMDDPWPDVLDRMDIRYDDTETTVEHLELGGTSIGGKHTQPRRAAEYYGTTP